MNCLAIRLEVYASAFEVVDIPVGHTFIVGNIDYAFCGSMTLEALVSLYQFREGSLFTSWGFSGRPLPLFRFNNPVNQPPSFWFGHHLKRFYFAFFKGTGGRGGSSSSG